LARRKAKQEEPKPDAQQLERQLIRTVEDMERQLHRIQADEIEKRKDAHRINLRSAFMDNHIFPPVVEETCDGCRIYPSLYMTKPLYRKIELLAQLKDISFQECLLWLADQTVESVLDNKDEIGPLLKKRILEEAYNLGKDSPISRKNKLEEALEGENL
jgi:hypothetical protein